MLDSNILCNDPFVMSLHQSHKDFCQWYYKVLYWRLLQDNSLDMMSLTQSTFLWTSFCIKVSNLRHRFSISNSRYGNFSILTIWQLILNRILSIHNNVDMLHPISYFQLLTSNQSSSNFGLSFDSCFIILVKPDSSPFSL